MGTGMGMGWDGMGRIGIKLEVNMGMGWDGMGRIGIKLEVNMEYGFKNRYLVDTLAWLHINQEERAEILASRSLWSFSYLRNILEFLRLSQRGGSISRQIFALALLSNPVYHFNQFIC
jgi:hypothetical protein